MEKYLLDNFKPLRVEETKNKIRIEANDKIYEFDHSLLFSAIYTNGKNILKNKTVVKLNENAEDFIFDEAECFVLKNDEYRATVITTAQSNYFIVNFKIEIAFDGYCNIDLKICPVGHTVNQTFGVSKNTDRNFILSELVVDFNLTNEMFKYYHYWPNYYADMMPIFDNDSHEFSSVCCSGTIKDSIHFGFKPVIYFGNDNEGFSFTSNSDKNWQPEYKKAVEILKKENIFRINLLKSHPKSWKLHEENPNFLQAYGFLPLIFNFGIEITPIKKLDNTVYNERTLHIDCFKKIKEDYHEFLLGKSCDSKYKCNLDYIKDKGVTMLYLHEKWNQIQNHFEIGNLRSKEIKEIIDECHKRNIKVIPYFGYEISSLSPLFGKVGYEMMQQVESQYPNNGGWYRVPYQRCYIECLNSDYRNIMLDGFRKLYDEFDFDGIYLDSTIYPVGCTNDHGCGYIGDDGLKHWTYPVVETREYIYQIYKLMKSKGKIVSLHTSNCLNIPAMAFSDVIWDGEAIQTHLFKNGIESVNKDYLFAELAKYPLGLDYEFLIYTIGDWTFKQGLSLCLPLNILPKPNDIEIPLCISNDIWNIYDMFGVNESKFVRQFENDKFKVDNKFLLGMYEKDNSYLLVISNPSSHIQNCKIDVNVDDVVLTNLKDNKIYYGSAFEIELEPCEVLMIKGEKNGK